MNAVSVRRRRRSIPENAKTSDVSKTEACSGEKCSYEVKGFEPYTNYKLAITAFNSGGEGPASEEIAFATLQDGNCALYNCFCHYVVIHSKNM